MTRPRHQQRGVGAARDQDVLRAPAFDEMACGVDLFALGRRRRVRGDGLCAARLPRRARDVDARLALDRAKAQLARTVRQVRAQLANVGQTEANVQLREVDLAKARAEAAVVARLDPLRGHYCRALLEVSAHETEAAFRELDAALRLAPDDYASLFQYGQLAANTGQHFERGLAAFRRCLELPPSWPPNTPHFGAHMWIGWMLEKQHDLAGARAAYEAALRLEPRFKPAAEALARIARKS